MIHNDETASWNLQQFSCLLKVFDLYVVQRFHGDCKTADVSVNICHTRQFQHTFQKICQNLPWLFFFSCYLNGLAASGDPAKIFYQKTALFSCKIFCFNADAVILLFDSPAQTGRHFILAAAYFYRKGTRLFCFSVIVAKLRIFISQIDPDN